MDKLKPCPFCGGKGTIEHKIALDKWIVQCSNGTCPASYMIGWDYETESEAIVAWNKRTPSGPAVPLDALCEWLAYIAGGKNNTLCIECCGSEGAECPDENCLCENPDAWKRHLTKWMEGLDAAD